jgi:hypothetical protein
MVAMFGFVTTNSFKACMVSSPRVISSGFSCFIANRIVKIMVLNLSVERLNSPEVQYFTMFYTSVNRPSLNSGKDM